MRKFYDVQLHLVMNELISSMPWSVYHIRAISAPHVTNDFAAGAWGATSKRRLIRGSLQGWI